MANPNLKTGGFYDLSVQFPASYNGEPTHDMLVGEFQDGRYHVMGLIPKGGRDFATAKEASRGDMGTALTLERGGKLNKLLPGDLIYVQFHGEEFQIEVRYLHRNARGASLVGSSRQ